MTDLALDAPGRTARWTCPFCLLLCDSMTVRPNADGTALEPIGDGICAGARAGLKHFSATPSTAAPRLAGRACSNDDAVAEAARLLAASGQPLFGGLGTDVAGARALYRLACATGAICDAAAGQAQMFGLRALQDRGSFTTTLAEVRSRADLIVCVGGMPTAAAPEWAARCGIGEASAPPRHIVSLGGMASDDTALAALSGLGRLSVQSLPLQNGDLFHTLQMLGALVAGRAVRDPPQHLAALAQRLAQARYSVWIGATGSLPAQGALIVEAVNQIVVGLNTGTRAGALWLGGGNGAGTVNQVFTWLSGLPLRSRAGPLGLEHEPLCFDAERLLQDHAVDTLLWVASFTPDSAPPATDLPLIVLGHPDSAAAARANVFIPVSTPGIGSAGHLFRADGGIVLPLRPVYDDTLPTVAEVVTRLSDLLCNDGKAA